MKHIVLVVLFLASFAVRSDEINNILINRIYVDPSDIVVLTDTQNGCGSTFYHLPRSNANFREMHAYMYLAFAKGLPINFNIDPTCNGDRVNISHGSMEAAPAP